MRSYRTAEQIIHQLHRRAATLDLVSFDVFDTLLHRRVAPPDQSKVPAARALVALLAQHGRKATLDEVLAARNAVESELRRAAADAGGDPECRIDALCRAWAACYFSGETARACAEQLLQAEVESELAVSCPVPGMLDAVRCAKELGKKVVFLSDMYLREEDIRRLLDSQGYAGLFDAGYVSAETGLAKYSGKLFDHVGREQNIEVARWLHVGDNPRADWWAPRRKGLQTCWFVEQDHKRRLRRQRRWTRLRRVDPSWRGAEWFELCRQEAEPQAQEDLRYAVGFSVLGPVLVNFVHQILEWAQAHDVRQVLFPAREGFILQRLFEVLKPQAAPDHPVQGEYVFLTRKATYLASLDELGVREIEMGMWTRRPTIRTMLTRFSLDAEELRPYARVCGLTLDEPIWDWRCNYKFLRFIRHRDVRRIVRGHAAEHRELLRDYLDQMGFWNAERAAVVDVGWHGTMQDALTCAFGDEPHWPRLWGWYVAFMAGKPYCETARSTYEGLLYQHRRDRVGAPGAALSNFVELLELATRAPHPTTIGLKRESSGEITPVFKPESSKGRQGEIRDRDLVASLQAGILDYAAAYARLIPFQDAGAEAYTAFALSNYDRLVRFPRKREALALLDFFHVEDFGTDHVMQENAATLRPWSPKAWKYLMTDAYRSLWPEGKVACMGLPGLIGAANVFRIFKGSFR